MSAKHGFIYIWRDRKHKRYYIGSHWGTETDGYICSSRWMRRSYNNRKTDFKRRVVGLVFTNRQDLYDLEQKWLNFINPSQIRTKYYNLHLSVKDPWYADPEKRLTIGQKISAKKKGKKTGPMSGERKANISAAKKGVPRSKAHNQALKEAGRKPLTEEHRKQIGEGLRAAYAEGKRTSRPKKEKRPLYAPGERQKQLWADPEWAANQRAKLKLARNNRQRVV